MEMGPTTNEFGRSVDWLSSVRNCPFFSTRYVWSDLHTSPEAKVVLENCGLVSLCCTEFGCQLLPHGQALPAVQNRSLFVHVPSIQWEGTEMQDLVLGHSLGSTITDEPQFIDTV